MIPESPRVSFWEASPAFRALCRRALGDSTWQWAEPQLKVMGERAAIEVAPLAAIADRESPRLIANRVEYNPAYREMERIAYGSGMLTMKYSPYAHSADASFVSFALGYLFAMAEMGLYCPLCMTDGVARVLTRFGTPEQVQRVVPHLASSDLGSLWTGGMFPDRANWRIGCRCKSDGRARRPLVRREVVLFQRRRPGRAGYRASRR